MDKLLDKKSAVGQSALWRVALRYRIPGRGALLKICYRLLVFARGDKKIITAKAAKITKEIRNRF